MRPRCAQKVDPSSRTKLREFSERSSSYPGLINIDLAAVVDGMTLAVFELNFQ